MSTTRADVEDVDFVDAVELLATGSSAYKIGVSVASSSNATSQIVISTTGPLNLDGFIYGDDPVESGDILTVSGSSSADGSYTLNAVLDNNTVTTVEAIPNSTGGTLTVSHPSGASRVGIDTSALNNSSATTLQQTLVDIDVAVGTGGGINVNDEGTAVPNTPHTTFNFVGAGVTAADAGGGIVDVTIPGGVSLEQGTLDVIFPADYDTVEGSVTGLSGTPVKVMPSQPWEAFESVQSGMQWVMTVTGLTAGGFNWMLRVVGDEWWPGPGPVTVRIPYLWSVT